MRIVYCIAGLYRPAGMERILVQKSAWLAARGHEVHILTTEQKGRPCAFDPGPGVHVRDLGIGYEDNNGGSFADKLIHYPSRQRRHLKALGEALAEIRPDVTISMFCNEVNLLPRLSDGSRKVLEVHFSRFKRLQYGRKGLWALADRYLSRKDLRTAKRYDRFVVLTREDSAYWGNLPNLRVIPNFVSARAESPAPLDGRTVIAVGRYSHQKGLDRLLDAWARIGDTGGWKLLLVGEGELRDSLQRRIRELGVEDSVQLTGAVTDMDTVYRNASVLALSSRYEGLPMVLLEAQAHGLPAVAFTCPCGPRDVLEDGVDGRLVEDGDIEGFAAALRQLMEDEALRKEMGAAAWRRSERWDMETTMKQWENLLQELS